MAMGMPPMLLEVKNLRAGYGPTQVLFGLDFAVVKDAGLTGDSGRSTPKQRW